MAPINCIRNKQGEKMKMAKETQGRYMMLKYYLKVSQGNTC